MNTLKKITAALCSATTLLALGASLSASAAGTLTIAGNEVEVSVDDPASMKGVAITMSIENNPNYATSGIGVRYDERLTPVLSNPDYEEKGENPKAKYELGTAATGAMPIVELDMEQNLIGWGSIAYVNISGDGVIATFYFDVPDDAEIGDEYKIEFEVDQICNDAKEELEFDSRAAVIKVTGTTTTTTETTTTTTETTTTTTETTTTTTETTTTTTETTTTSDTTTTISGAPEYQGKAVYQIDDVTGLAGTTVKVPVLVWYDEGTAGLTMQFTVPEGFKISGYEFGDAYTGADQAVWNPDEYIFVWDDPNGENQIAESGKAILYLLVDVPEDAVDNQKYPVDFVEVTVSDTNSTTPEFTTVNGSITIIPNPGFEDPGHVVYHIGDALAEPGSSVELPVEVWYDEGTASFSMKFVVPEGFTVTDFAFGDAYSAVGTFNFDAATGVLTWASTDGTEFAPTAGTLIGTLTVAVGEDVEAGEYPVTLADVAPVDAEGAALKYQVVDGTITVSDLELTVITDYKIEFEKPTRVYYWSHDTRTFAESGGLTGMSAYIYYYQYYVAGGYFVDEKGEQILDADGNPMAYDETNPVYPGEAHAFNVVGLDVTSNTKPDENADSPIEVYVPGTHAYPIALYYDQTGSDIIVGDGEPLLMGEIEIYIGLKGDITLDDAVDTRDALDALKYYVLTTVMNKEYLFHEAEVDHELAFYLGDVYYTQNYDTKTAQSILQYYVLKDVVGKNPTWTEVVGYDFPDSFFEGTTN